MLAMPVTDAFLELVSLTDAAKIELLSTAYSNRVITQELAIQLDRERADAIAQLERLGLLRVEPFLGPRPCGPYGLPADPDAEWLEITLTRDGKIAFRKLKEFFYDFGSQHIVLRKN